jgi:aryl-alcohol dehydrogenase-like predicted oxidoreductase
MKATDRVRLGRTELHVTRLGLGLAPIGGLFTAVAEHDAHATVEAAWQLGLRYFDTAPLYGLGLSERRAGAVLSGKPRDEFVLSTKVGRRLVPGTRDRQQIWAEDSETTTVWDFTADGVRAAYQQSRDRLGLDRADILYLHDPDDHFDAATAHAFPALADLRTSGDISAVGAGMNQSQMLTRFARAADFDCFMLAGRYTLLDQSALADLLPVCVDRGIAVIAAAVLNSGLLANPQPGATYDYVPADQELLQRARDIERVCLRHGVPLRAAALQFPLGHAAVASVVVGARSPQEVADSVAMFEHPIPAALWTELKDEGLLLTEAPTP